MTAPLPDMPAVQYAEVNGIRMAYYEAGPKGVGVPIVFSHGFPEIAYSWRHQIKALADAGRWVIAPDQRGYGLTKGPEAVEAYDIENLTADLIGLIDHCGAKTAIWCGHDWGGFVVWQMALRYPQRTAGVIGLNTPYTPRGSTDPIAVMRARMGEEMYIVHFQKPGEADAILAKNPRNTMDFFLRRPLNAPPAGAIAHDQQGRVHRHQLAGAPQDRPDRECRILAARHGQAHVVDRAKGGVAGLELGVAGRKFGGQTGGFLARKQVCEPDAQGCQ